MAASDLEFPGIYIVYVGSVFSWYMVSLYVSVFSRYRRRRICVIKVCMASEAADLFFPGMYMAAYMECPGLYCCGSVFSRYVGMATDFECPGLYLNLKSLCLK